MGFFVKRPVMASVIALIFLLAIWLGPAPEREAEPC